MWHKHFENNLNENGELIKEADAVLKLTNLWFKAAKENGFNLEDMLSACTSMMVNFGVRLSFKNRQFIIDGCERAVEILKETPQITREMESNASSVHSN